VTPREVIIALQGVAGPPAVPTRPETAFSPSTARFEPFPPPTPLARWREPVPGLPEEAWPDMVTLPAGVFTMGAPAGEEGSADGERPQRQVTVPRPFALGRVAVTFAQWDAAVAAGFVPPKGAEKPKDIGWGRYDAEKKLAWPAINVSWDDAQAYCAWLNERLGLRPGTYRLPSEAEWEYACRAGTTTAFSFGDTITKEQLNFNGMGTVPVGALPANAWGLHEMHGNVWEWCEDAFGDYPDHATDARPLTPSDSSLRVLRGGSWVSYPRFCRSASRSRYPPIDRSYYLGFRLARTLF
jgi:formylglycine-generating enzyme required for sulfatase activity